MLLMWPRGTILNVGCLNNGGRGGGGVTNNRGRRARPGSRVQQQSESFDAVGRSSSGSEATLKRGLGRGGGWTRRFFSNRGGGGAMGQNENGRQPLWTGPHST